MGTQSINRDKYFMLCIDDYSRMTWIQFLKHKFEALDRFNIFKNQAKNQINRRIKCLILDRGDEFLSYEFTKYYKKYRIKR